ncbi:MAG: hypothetical protein ABR915_05450 [Thermoguttaceae bacterium]|jgi:hypothetical protein
MVEFIRKIQDAWGWLPPVASAVAAVVGLLVLVILWRLLRRRRPVALPAAQQLGIDVSSLHDAGPRTAGPVLEFYGLPVRLAAVVLAPAGRGRGLPPPASLGECLDALVPALGSVVALDEPLVRRWPPQLAVRGFARAFFANARLPGDCGKGTPWSSAAGALKFRGQAMMIGLVLRAAAPNGLGQMILDSEQMWLGCLRVRSAGAE